LAFEGGIEVSASTASTASVAHATAASGPTTNGGLVDFIVAIVCMIVLLQAHKLLREFLDKIVPGGGRGPSALFSGIAEGMGLAAGMSLFRGGTKVLGSAATLGASAGVAGLAGAFAHPKGAGSILSDLWSHMKPRRSQPFEEPSPMPEAPGLPEGEDPLRLTGGAAGFTTSDGLRGPGLGERYDASEPSGAPEQKRARDEAVNTAFDVTSQHHGAYTRMMPSAEHKATSVAKSKSRLHAAGLAFQNQLSADVRAWGVEGKRPKVTLASLVRAGERGYREQQDAHLTDRLLRDAHRPSEALQQAAQTGDPIAMAHLRTVGVWQSHLAEGLLWMDQGEKAAALSEPSYQDAKARLDAAEANVESAGIAVSGYTAAGDTSSRGALAAKAKYEQAVEQREHVKSEYAAREQQRQAAEQLRSRGEQRVLQSQNEISKINYAWYPEQQNTKRLRELAIARAGRTSLSDLSEPVSKRGAKRS